MEEGNDNNNEEEEGNDNNNEEEEGLHNAPRPTSTSTMTRMNERGLPHRT